MATGYFAQVADGIVTDIRRVTAERIAENPDLYPGEWVEIADMSMYPAVGWKWSAAGGFLRPAEDVI
jgi:hypothetical protein